MDKYDAKAASIKTIPTQTEPCQAFLANNFTPLKQPSRPEEHMEIASR